MSKQAEADLILKLYEIRREPLMRAARDWFFQEFHPASLADINAIMMGEHSAKYRMVVSYWEMAASLVKHGAIDVNLFDDTNAEQYVVFAKVEPFLAEYRAAYGPNVFRNLEGAIDSAPNGRERLAKMQERMKAMFVEKARAKTAV